jgi:hypothetical protein
MRSFHSAAAAEFLVACPRVWKSVLTFSSNFDSLNLKTLRQARTQQSGAICVEDLACMRTF